MPRPDRLPSKSAPTFSFWLLAVFLVILWFAGGASRADAAGQALVRFCAWLMLIGYIMIGSGFDWRRVRPVAIILGLAVFLVALHLVPLPPSVWTALPGRDLLTQAATATDQAQPWRPISVSPGATMNALGSLIVPVFALVLMASLPRQHNWRILAVLLALIIAGSLLGLLQFSGARYDNPLINDIRGMVSGPFANRNHFALFVAIGCLLLPAWAFREGGNHRWKAIAAMGVLVLLILLILAIGSRMGIVVGIVGVTIGIVAVHEPIRRAIRGLPRKLVVPLAVGIVALIALAIVLSITFDRAASIDRALNMEASADSRAHFLPVVIDLVGHYFPVGSGFGAFDPVYRIGEPNDLLQTRYLNHAHNDWVELALDGGVMAILLAAAGVLWWLFATFRAWQGGAARNTLARLGSGILLLGMIASLSDYPARTPMIMAVLIIGAVWLNEGSVVEKSRQAM